MIEKYSELESAREQAQKYADDNLCNVLMSKMKSGDLEFVVFNQMEESESHLKVGDRYSVKDSSHDCLNTDYEVIEIFEPTLSERIVLTYFNLNGKIVANEQGNPKTEKLNLKPEHCNLLQNYGITRIRLLPKSWEIDEYIRVLKAEELKTQMILVEIPNCSKRILLDC